MKLLFTVCLLSASILAAPTSNFMAVARANRKAANRGNLVLSPAAKSILAPSPVLSSVANSQEHHGVWGTYSTSFNGIKMSGAIKSFNKK
jgi:hypothetical protein